MNSGILNRNVLLLISISIISVVLWQFQIGRYIIYPFTIIGTWFHEIGHGITAIIFGGTFNYLQLFPDGSGLAVHSGELIFGNLGRALVAAGGPVFPFIFGSSLVIISVKSKSSNIFLLAFGLLMLLTVALWIRTIFGIAVITIIAGLIIIISIRANKKINEFVLQLLGIEACVSFYLNIGYYFSSGGVIEGKSYYSDTQVIANNLFLPYWFWGGLIVAISIFVIIFSLRIIAGENKSKADTITQSI